MITVLVSPSMCGVMSAATEPAHWVAMAMAMAPLTAWASWQWAGVK